MLDWTQRLVRIDKSEFGSGVLVRRGERVFLLTAGHVMDEGQWTVETNWIVGDQVVSFATGKPQAFYSVTEDFAWSEIDLRSIARQVRSDDKLKEKGPDIRVYDGPLDRPVERSMPYVFAAWKAAEFVTGARWLVRDPIFELWMEYVGVELESKMLMFKPNDGHRGHANYAGCSGAPIAGADGLIVALVVRGHPKENPEFILGVPLDDKERYLGNPPSK